MQLTNFSTNSSWIRLSLILSCLLLLSNCTRPAAEPELMVQTEYVSRTIPLQSPPDPVELTKVKWYVVTEKNLPEFLEQFEKDNGVVAFMAISVQGYENMAMNVQELRRYILQQKSIIVYYEQAAQEPTNP